MADLKAVADLFRSAPNGTRVGAIASADDDVVRLYGYGVRIEDQVPDETETRQHPALKALHEHELPNPTILLDDGGIVYGAECWWGPEQSIVNWIGDRRVIHVAPRR